MKKVIYFILALIPTNFLFSNPIVLPQAIVSELIFDESNNWRLEIGFQYGEFYSKEKFDSICIASSNGFSRIKLSNIKDSTELFVINSDSLTSPLTLQKEGDYIKVYSFLSSQYYYSEPLIDSLIFGNYLGSTIDSFQKGYSIVRIFYNLFSKSKNPTIGLPNDTTGTCGILTGHIYDRANNLVTKGNFRLDNPLYFQNNGSYLTNVYSRKVSFNRIENNFEPHTYQNVEIDSLELNINPDSIYNKDINFLSDYLVGVNDIKIETNVDISIANYPNPFNSTTIFIIKVPVNLHNKESMINIYNILGKRVYTINFMNSSRVSWKGKDFNGNSVSSGIYYYQLIVGNKIYKNGSMILLK